MPPRPHRPPDVTLYDPVYPDSDVRQNARVAGAFSPHGAPEQVERLIGSAPMLGHQDPLGLLDDGHCFQPGLEPGVRGIVRYLPFGSALTALLEGFPQTCPGLFGSLRLSIELTLYGR